MKTLLKGTEALGKLLWVASLLAWVLFEADMESAIFRRRNSDILLALAGERTGAGDKRRWGARPVKVTL